MAPEQAPSPVPDPLAGAPRDCPRCPRLVAFRLQNQGQFPAWYNAPVPGFGDPQARLIIVGLAPGLRGANRTGRPFTGDHAGLILYQTLIEQGWAKGTYAEDPADGLRLVDARIVNAVRCVPPQNKPTPAEIATCQAFLSAEVAALPRARVFIALGRIAHDAVVRVHGLRLAAHPFAHQAAHALPQGRRLIDSYHCSRYNTQTGRLTAAMFQAVFAQARALLDA